MAKKQKRKGKPKTIAIAVIAFLMGCGLTFAGVLGLGSHWKNQTISENKAAIESHNLTEAVDGYVTYVGTFYKYNISNTGKRVTFKQLEEEGGVCSQWADLYQAMAELDGFYGQTVLIPYTNDSGHAIALVSNQEGFCTIDQTNYLCWLRT